MKLPGFLQNRKLQTALGSVFLYVVSTGVSFMVFTTFIKGPIDIITPFGKLTDFTSGDEEGTKDKECPINGAMYTKARENKWKERRPLGVMVENHLDARPTSGLSRADTVYEAVAEGGITRFLVVYYCQDAGDIAPIRSARTYFIDWLSEYDAIYSHVGGANAPGPADALGQIREYAVKDLDQFGAGFPTYWRGTDKLAPHNVHSTTTKLWEAAAERGYGPEDEEGVRWDKNFTIWKFKDEAAIEQRGNQPPVTVPFWENSDYTVTWKYDKNTNSYQRFHGETAQIDSTTTEQLTAKNVIVQFQKEKNANDGHPDGHLVYGTTGSGTALIFLDGKATEGKWSKEERTSRTKFTDENGKEVELNRGLVWIQTIPVGNEVTY